MLDVQGIYNIWKPVGMTSHDVVHKIRKITQVRKVGHAGTLDPLAEGVLVICVGRKYTKQISSVVGKEKEYIFGLKLGIETETYDREGKVVSEKKVEATDEQIKKACSKYRGKIKQLPPMFSAVKHNGKRLYKLARKGIEVEREPRDVLIKEIEVLDINRDDKPEITLRVVCGSGTYIRSLCHDIGRDLGCGGYASFIRRTRVGDYAQEQSLTIEEFETNVNK